MASPYSYSSSESDDGKANDSLRFKIKLNKGNGNIVNQPSQKDIKISSLKTKKDREVDFYRSRDTKMSSLKSKKDREREDLYEWRGSKKSSLKTKKDREKESWSQWSSNKMSKSKKGQGKKDWSQWGSNKISSLNTKKDREKLESYQWRGTQTSSLKSKMTVNKADLSKWRDSLMASLGSKKDKEEVHVIKENVISHKWQQNAPLKGKGSGANDISSIKKQLEYVQDTENDEFIENLDFEPRRITKTKSGPRDNSKQFRNTGKGDGVKTPVNNFESDSDIEILPDLKGWDSSDESKDVYG